jgi:hypothetical protein
MGQPSPEVKQQELKITAKQNLHFLLVTLPKLIFKEVGTMLPIL